MHVWRDKSGTSAKELALLAPLFIMIFLGVTAYGIHVRVCHSVQQLAADAARAATGGLNEAERRSLASAFIRTNAAGYLFVDPQQLTVNAHDSATERSRFVVALRYDIGTLPIWGLVRNLAVPGKTVFRQSTICLRGI